MRQLSLVVILNEVHDDWISTHRPVAKVVALRKVATVLLLPLVLDR